jgi:DNA-binding XRE family transcriptional regulator
MITAADIRASRAREDETQEQFAARIGVKRATLAAWEKATPTHPMIQNLLTRILAELAVQRSGVG